MRPGKPVKIAFIGGGSPNWAPTIIRDIVFKRGMERADIDFRLLDIDLPRAHAIKALFDVKFKEWKVRRARIHVSETPEDALTDADVVLIAISTGRLEAMRHDLEIPERYGIYHTVGDTVGPGGWSRSWRNIPVFRAYARQIKELAPNSFVLNYTNPLATLTKTLADELGSDRVVGLCHGLFECYDVLKAIFELESEKEIQVRFGGLNHFFWILDLKIAGRDGHKLLNDKLQGKNFATLVKDVHKDGMGFSSDKWLAGELFDNYGYLPFLADRHTCEFFNCYITDLDMMERFKLERTSIEFREEWRILVEERVRRWTVGEKADIPFTPQPSRETAADIINAIAFNEHFTDVVNTVNTGQISNLPTGVVVETMGMVDSSGFLPLATGPMPEALRSTLMPHAEVQLRTVEAALAREEEQALMALVADPACAHLTISDIKKMGRELIAANKRFMTSPQE